MLQLVQASFVCLASLHAQTGPRVQTVVSTVDGSEQPYALYLPRSFETPREYGLLISLHSEDSNHRMNLSQVLGIVGRGAMTMDGMSFPPMRDHDLIVACPLARGAMGYQGIAEQDVYDVVADVERRYPVDRDRVYLTGISMGGGGALWLAETHPDMWAGIAAMCPDSMPGSEELAPNLLNVPLRLYHGEADTIVPVASSRAWQRRLSDCRRARGIHRISLRPGTTFGTWPTPAAACWSGWWGCSAFAARHGCTSCRALTGTTRLTGCGLTDRRCCARKIDARRRAEWRVSRWMTR